MLEKHPKKGIGGLILEEKDPNNFPLGALIRLPKLSELPQEYRIEVKIKNQGGNDKCTGYASTLLSEPQENVVLNPDYVFAASKEISGNPEAWGQTIKNILKAHVSYGTIKQTDVPHDMDVEDNKYRNLLYWPEDLKQKAKFHSKETYWEVTGPYDHFDNIRASIWYFKDKKQGTLLGCLWDYPDHIAYIEEIAQEGFGHCIACVGWAHREGKDWLVIANSSGKEVGEQGYFYFSRPVINKIVGKLGAYMLVDISREKAEWMLQNLIKSDDNWLIELLKVGWTFIKSIFTRR